MSRRCGAAGRGKSSRRFPGGSLSVSEKPFPWGQSRLLAQQTVQHRDHLGAGAGVVPAEPVAAHAAGDADKVAKYAELLYDQALLIAGLPIEDPVAYAQLVCGLMQ